MWATCNFGANNPWEYGDYYAWGETHPRDEYTWTTYKYAFFDSNKLTKYCDYQTFGKNGFVDNLTTIQPEDDAVRKRVGGGIKKK